MGRAQNRRLETAVFELLRESYAELADGEIDHGEAPEFVVSSADGRLGIEVTSLHGPDPAKGSVEVQRRAASGLFLRLLDEHVKAVGAPCVVTFQIMHAIRGGKRRARQLAGEAIRMLEPALARRGVMAEWDRLQRDVELPPELNSLEVHWPPTLKRPVVLMGGEGFLISSDFEAPLRQALAAKARKFDSYLRRSDRCWLAVVLPHYFEAEDERVPSPALVAFYDSPFERVFVVDHQLRRTWSLRTQSEAGNRSA